MTTWDEVIARLVQAFNTYNAINPRACYKIGEDDVAMRDASAADLIDWVADTEARLDVDCDDFRAAMFDYLDARDTAIASAIVAEAYGNADAVTPHDPRGSFVAGAEVEQPAGEYRPIGFYMADDGTWHICDYAGEDFAMCDGRGNYDRAQVVETLREAFAHAQGGDA